MIGIIGGTGLTQLNGLILENQQWYDTPYGEPSAAIRFGKLAGTSVAFLARHGDPHQIPPHIINYRANLHALKQAGVTQIVSINAVGGIHQAMGPAEIAIPDQILDYTYGREHTIYDADSGALEHVDFTNPYTASLRMALLSAAKSEAINVLDGGCYGATQGPRLETAAEIRRLAVDGCDMVGMTGMPEASLARELGLGYASVALSVNWCAGLTDTMITMDDIQRAIEKGMSKVHRILGLTVANLGRS